MNNEWERILGGVAGERLRASAELELSTKRAEALEQIRSKRAAAQERRAAMAAELEAMDSEFCELDSQWAELNAKRNALLGAMGFVRSEIRRSQHEDSNRGKLRDLATMAELDTEPLRRLQAFIQRWSEPFPDSSSPSPVKGTRSWLEGHLCLRMLTERLDELRLTSPDPEATVNALIREWEPKFRSWLQKGRQERSGQFSLSGKPREAEPATATKTTKNGDHW